MTPRQTGLAFAAVVAVAAVGYGLYFVERGRAHHAHAHAPAATSAAAQPASDRKVLYWHDPMVPGARFDKPGKSPFMDMQLVPMYADEGGEPQGVQVSSRMQQSLGLRLATAREGELAPVIEAVGTVAYNDRDVAVVQARATGFIEKLHVRAALDRVRKGAPLAELYVPDWVAAQEEYLVVARLSDPSLAALREGAEQRMRLAGMSEEQVRLVVASGRVNPRTTLTAPIDGIVTELAAREGMTVTAGAPLFRINGLASIWVNAEIPEALSAQVRTGGRVEARAAALPGRTFKGQVGAILPEVDTATRTLKARIELGNPGGALVPGMFATINFAPAARREAVLVPSEAVIQTGKRAVVIVAETGAGGSRRFRPVDVETGAESGGMTEIRKGIGAGTQVVASGQFLIDSEASLKAMQGRLGDGS